MTKIDPKRAILSLLRPGEPDSFDGDYLESVLDELERHRTAFARDMVECMTSDFGPLKPSQVAAVRAKYLDKLLAFRPADMEAILASMMEDREDYGRAATMFLHGHAQGYWKASDGMLAHACELAGIAPNDCRASADAKLGELITALVASAIWKAARMKVERRRIDPKKLHITAIRELLGADRQMRAALSDPMSSDAQRIAAIENFFAHLLANGMADLIKDALGE